MFVPGLKINLLSLGQLFERGYTLRLKDKIFQVYDKKHYLI